MKKFITRLILCLFITTSALGAGSPTNSIGLVINSSNPLPQSLGGTGNTSGTATPSGSAGGDLAGSTYPNPTVTSNAITYVKFQQIVANSLFGNPMGSTANGQAIGLGSTLTFSGTALQTLAFSGDFTTPPNSFVATLATVNSNVGSFGDATHTVTETVNGKGLITAVSSNLITPAGIGAPTTTGTGASGTWGISISGNAATATSSTTATNSNNSNTTVSSSNASFYLPFVASSSSGYQALNINSNLNYNPLSGVLTLPNITLTAPSASQLIGLNSGGNIAAIGAGTSTTILHGNASGLPTYSAVSLTADVTGTLPNSNTTAASANTASAIVARDGSGNFTAGTITAALSGNATTATTATTATNANNVATTQVSNSASYYPLLAASSTNSNQAPDIGTGLTFNPNTNTLQTTALTLTGLTLRSVLYASASGGIIGDSSNFVYDGSGHNLFLGSNSISPPGVGRLNLNGADSTAGNSQAFYTSLDTRPLLQFLPFAHDNVSLNFDAYYSGGWVSSSSNASFQIAKTASALTLDYGVATAGSALTWSTGLSLSTTGTVTVPQLTANSLVTTGTGGLLVSSNTLSSTVLGNITKATITTFAGGASGNYTPPAGCTSILVRGWGGGGGGGGVAGAAASAGGAGGGGSGGHFQTLLTAPFGGAPFAYTVGSGGAGGASGANNGSNGSNTTFGSITAGHGDGGAGVTSGVSAQLGGGGNITASSGTADIITTGNAGSPGFALSSSIAVGGNGATAPAGGGGGRGGLTGTGGAGGLPGGGGAGGALTSNSNVAGGAGGDGKLLIYEYYNG